MKTDRSESPMRLWIRRSLYVAAFACIAFVNVSVWITIGAGSVHVLGNDGHRHLYRPSLSMVRFKGRLRAEATDPVERDDVNFYLFPNSFAYERPSGGSNLSSFAVHDAVRDGPLFAKPVTFPLDMAVSAAYLGLPEEDYRCIATIDDHERGPCQSEFLAAWHNAHVPKISINNGWPISLYFYVLGIGLVMNIRELKFRFLSAPTSWYCLNYIKKRAGRPPTEKPPFNPQVRYEKRRVMVVLMVVTYAVASWWLYSNTRKLAAYLGEVDAKVGGLQVEVGQAFPQVSRLTMAAIGASWGLLKLRNDMRPVTRTEDMEKRIPSTKGTSSD